MLPLYNPDAKVSDFVLDGGWPTTQRAIKKYYCSDCAGIITQLLYYGFSFLKRENSKMLKMAYLMLKMQQLE